VKRAIAFATVALVATACRTLPFPDPDLEGEYGLALKKWTRQVALYSGLETRAFVRVVNLSPEFVTAQALQISQMRAEMPDKAAETLAKMREEYRQPSFFAVVYTPDKTANDWNEPNSVWRIALNLGLGEVPPQKIQRFEVPFNAELKVLYPYLDEYSVAYLLKFADPVVPPSAPAAAKPALERFTPVEAVLTAAGALGKMRFRWRLDGGPETPPEADPGLQEQPNTTPR
jgi:hypothetical protein